MTDLKLGKVYLFPFPAALGGPAPAYVAVLTDKYLVLWDSVNLRTTWDRNGDMQHTLSDKRESAIDALGDDGGLLWDACIINSIEQRYEGKITAQLTGFDHFQNHGKYQTDILNYLQADTLDDVLLITDGTEDEVWDWAGYMVLDQMVKDARVPGFAIGFLGFGHWDHGGLQCPAIVEQNASPCMFYVHRKYLTV